MKNLSKEVERLEALKEKLEDKATQMEADRDNLDIDELGEKAYWKNGIRWTKQSKDCTAKLKPCRKPSICW